MRYFILLAVITLTACTSGRLTPRHNDCGVPPLAWSKLAAPPDSATDLITLAAAKPRKDETDIWFRDGRDRLLLCIKDVRREFSCGSARWVFVTTDGGWRVDETAKEASVTVCAD